MTFPESFSPRDQIDLLERWILVNSFAYYELDSNIASDFAYDANANQLFSLESQYPEDYQNSRYFKYFTNYEPGCTSGFELVRNVKKDDKDLYERIWYDALMALDIKRREQNGSCNEM